jgi:hypothetical protein
VSEEADAVDRAMLLRQLWRAQAAPLATEIGAVGALALTAYAGVGIAVLALVVLEVALSAVSPPSGVIRVVVLVAGPPLRYLLLLLAVWRTWVDPPQGLIPALALVLGLAFAVPLAAFLIAQSRARRA